MSKQKTICVHNMFSPCSELVVFMHWTGKSLNNLLSYCGLVDVRTNASDKDLPVQLYKACRIHVNQCSGFFSTRLFINLMKNNLIFPVSSIQIKLPLMKFYNIRIIKTHSLLSQLFFKAKMDIKTKMNVPFKVSRIFPCVARNIDKFCDSCKAWLSAITFRNWAALR